jgi:hypothetical protein
LVLDGGDPLGVDSEFLWWRGPTISLAVNSFIMWSRMLSAQAMMVPKVDDGFRQSARARSNKVFRRARAAMSNFIRDGIASHRAACGQSALDQPFAGLAKSERSNKRIEVNRR